MGLEREKDLIQDQVFFSPNQMILSNYKAEMEDVFWKKLDLAKVFLSNANNIWGEYLQQHPSTYELRSVDDHVQVCVETVTPLPIEFSILIGASLNQIRSVLDHVAWAFSKPKRGMERVIQFPVFTDRTSYEQRKNNMLFGANQKFIDAVDKMQPFTGTPQSEALCLLSELTNIDKHRALLAAVSRLESAHLNSVTSGTARLEKQIIYSGKLSPGFVLADLWLGKPEVGDTLVINPHLTLAPVFDLQDAPFVDGRPIFDIATTCFRVVREEVLPSLIAC